jgi:hypothetical protein
VRATGFLIIDFLSVVSFFTNFSEILILWENFFPGRRRIRLTTFLGGTLSGASLRSGGWRFFVAEVRPEVNPKSKPGSMFTLFIFTTLGSLWVSSLVVVGFLRVEDKLRGPEEVKVKLKVSPEGDPEVIVFVLYMVMRLSRVLFANLSGNGSTLFSALWKWIDTFFLLTGNGSTHVECVLLACNARTSV